MREKSRKTLNEGCDPAVLKLAFSAGGATPVAAEDPKPD
jgi:hypothetical protein